MGRIEGSQATILEPEPRTFLKSFQITLRKLRKGLLLLKSFQNNNNNNKDICGRAKAENIKMNTIQITYND